MVGFRMVVVLTCFVLSHVLWLLKQIMILYGILTWGCTHFCTTIISQNASHWSCQHYFCKLNRCIKLSLSWHFVVSTYLPVGWCTKWMKTREKSNALFHYFRLWPQHGRKLHHLSATTFLYFRNRLHQAASRESLHAARWCDQVEFFRWTGLLLVSAGVEDPR